MTTDAQPERVEVERRMAELAIRLGKPDAPDMANVDQVTVWIERTRALAFLAGARHEEISWHEARCLTALAERTVGVLSASGDEAKMQNDEVLAERPVEAGVPIDSQGPAGWKLVPINATPKMTAAGDNRCFAADMWPLMLDAAPEPPIPVTPPHPTAEAMRGVVQRVINRFPCTHWDAGARLDLTNEITAALAGSSS